MGLMYPFPVSMEETDFVEHKNDKLILKTYGLPYIFWFYALCVTIVIAFMFLAIKAPVLKLIALGDETDALLGYSLLATIAASPIIMFAFFFYEKRIVASTKAITLEYRVFAIKFFSETFPVEKFENLLIEPYLSSPNVARMKGGQEGQGFQNKGYFVLWLKLNEHKKILIDRHSRKVDLEKLKSLLEPVVDTHS